jgi:MFS family permease
MADVRERPITHDLSLRPPPGLLSGHRRPLTIGLVLLVTLVAFEGLAVATALPVVRDDLGGTELYGLVFSAYMLTNLVGIAFAGQQADRGSPAPAFAAGLVIFGAGLVISGAAPSMPVVVAGRAVQGFGGGCISTIAYVTIGRGYEEELRPRMFAVMSTAWVLPGVIGPALAGAIAEHVSWRLVFLGLLPLLPVNLAMTLPAIRRIGAPTVAEDGARLAVALQLAAGAAMVVGGLAIRFVPATAALVAAGCLVGVPALKRLMPEGTLRAAPGLPAAIACIGLFCSAFFGAEAFLPLTLNEVRGQSPTLAGLALTAATLTWTAGSWIQARRTKEWTPRFSALIGVSLVAAGIAVAGSTAYSQAPVIAAALGWGIGGLGMGIAWQTMTLTVLSESEEEKVGASSAALNLSYVLGIALGTGLGGAVLAAGDSAGWDTAVSVGAVFGIMVAVAVVAFAAASRLPGRAPAA